MSYELMDGVERNRAHPDTFHIPYAEELDAIKVGFWVKVGAMTPKAHRCEAERFWVKVTEVTPEGFKGTVDNDTVLANHHGLRYMDIVSIERRHVLATMAPPAQ